MCGLFGVASSSLTQQERFIFSQLAYLACFRGTDSTGCAAITRDKHGKLNVRTHKTTDNPVTFVESADFFDSILTHNPLIMMGHARAATVGEIKQSNAHPFRCGHIIGAHNGTIPKLGSKDKTDSEELYLLIQRHGLKALDSIEGAYALTYMDTNTKTVNFIRNVQRPLCWMRGGQGVLVWASEYRMLSYLKDVLGWGSSTITMFEAGKHYSMAFGSIEIKDNTSAPVVLPATTTQNAPTTTTLVPPVQRVQGYPYSTDYPFLNRPQNIQPSAAERHIQSKYVWRMFGNEYLSAEAYRERLAAGCSNCTKVATPAQKVIFVDRNDYLCSDCQQDGLLMSMFGHNGTEPKLVKRETINE